MKVIGTFLSNSGDDVAVWAFQSGYLYKVYEVINIGVTDEKIMALFGLSNVTGSTNQEHIKAVLEEELLMERILQICKHSNVVLFCEATWVLTNAITCCDDLARG